MGGIMQASLRWVQDDERIDMVCPACTDPAPKQVRLRLSAAWLTPSSQPLAVCSACGTMAFPTPAQAPSSFDRQAAFHLEQNVGIDTLARLLACADPGTVRRFLDIGSSYGLLTDYVRTMLGWEVRAFGPVPDAPQDREALGADISPGYPATPADAGPDPYELIFCSDLVARVADPAGLLTVLRKALTPGGIVLLSVPGTGGIEPEAPAHRLAARLHPGRHHVLYSRQGLEILLRRSGFVGLTVAGQGQTLQAAASPGPPTADFARSWDRGLYCSYLEARVPATDHATPLGLGLRYRLMKELTHAGAYARARTAAAEVARAVAARWADLDLSDPAGLLDRLGALPEELGADAWHRAAPFNLCSILYCHGILAWQSDGDRERAALWFRAAILAGGRMRAALHRAGADDGETEELVWRAYGHLPHLLVWSRPLEAAEGALRLDEAGSPILPGESMPPGILAEARRRVLIDLVNLQHYAAADRLAFPVEETLPEDGPDLVTAAFALGLLTLNFRRAPRTAARLFGRVHDACRQILLRGPAPAAEAVLWASVCHQGKALADAHLYREAKQTLARILEPEAGLPSVPDELRGQAESLMRSLPLSA